MERFCASKAIIPRLSISVDFYDLSHEIPPYRHTQKVLCNGLYFYCAAQITNNKKENKMIQHMHIDRFPQMQCFYRLPTFLFQDAQFMRCSNHTKLMYALILSRSDLSKKTTGRMSLAGSVLPRRRSERGVPLRTAKGRCNASGIAACRVNRC
jgi:Replication initiator protein A (RepA) N-terminus.